jgi:hypothetical protein
MGDELHSRVAVLEEQARTARARDEQILRELKDATQALWAAVDELRSRSAVSPTVAVILSTLTAVAGAAVAYALGG